LDNPTIAKLNSIYSYNVKILPRGSQYPTGGRTPISFSKDIFKFAPTALRRIAGANALTEAMKANKTTLKVANILNMTNKLFNKF
jgi:hypothetical protein